jgi:MFS family permease
MTETSAPTPGGTPGDAIRPAFRDKLSWYLGTSAFWFATGMKWFVLLQLLPHLVGRIVPPDQKDLWWGRISGIGAIEAMIGPAVFGYLSDRCRSRYGRRRPFIAVGAALTAIALLFLAGADTLWLFFVGYLALQISDDVGTGPYAALVPDYVPESRRGRASGILSQLQLIAQVVGAVLGMAASGRPEVILYVIAAVNLVCAAIVIVTVHEPPGVASTGSATGAGVASTGSATGAGVASTGSATGAAARREPRPPVGVGTTHVSGRRLADALRRGVAQWIEPWRSHDFRWVWFTRFLNSLGFYIILNYLVFYMQERVRVFRLPFVTLDGALQATIALTLLISIAGAVGAVWGGNMADRIGRKRTIYAAGWLMGATLVPFALVPHYGLIVLLSPVFGLGYGTYLSATWALTSDVLPSKEDTGRDMGIWQMSVAAPQVVAGLVVGAVIYAANRVSPGLGYSIAFMFSSLAFLAGSLLVRLVRGSS